MYSAVGHSCQTIDMQLPDFDAIRHTGIELISTWNRRQTVAHYPTRRQADRRFIDLDRPSMLRVSLLLVVERTIYARHVDKALLLWIQRNVTGHQAEQMIKLHRFPDMKNNKLRVCSNEFCLDFEGTSTEKIVTFLVLSPAFKIACKIIWRRNFEPLPVWDIHLFPLLMLNPKYIPIWYF